MRVTCQIATATILIPDMLSLLQVGACVVLQEPRRAISVGYNGLPDGRKDHSGIEDPKKYGIAQSMLF